VSLDALDEVRFLLQMHTDARRTLLCEPARVDAVRAAVEQLGAGGVFTVAASAACPVGRILVVDEQALDAAWRQTVQQIGCGIRVR